MKGPLVTPLRPFLLCAVLVATVLPASALAADSGSQPPQPRGLDQVIPAPASVEPGGDPFTLTEHTPIRLSSPSGEARKAARELTDLLRPPTGYPLPVTRKGGDDGIRLRLVESLRDGRPEKGDSEAYRLKISKRSVEITATDGAGLFHAVRTIRQLLPAAVEARDEQPGPWQIAGGTVTDRPRYAFRGAMLDVSRHFLEVPQVKRYINRIAQYKMNTLQLHLSDDQGWRIAIDSWPRLARYGGGSEVGGGPGGHYTKADYKEIVDYAAARHVTVVPEIDMPGHTNAALASYAKLNCDGVAPPRYTGIKIGFSSLCVKKDLTYDFVDDVVREVAAMTPGPYLHIGGDEAHATEQKDYTAFMDRAQRTVAKYGKTVIGWHQLTGGKPADGAVAQYWGTSGAEKKVGEAARNGTRLILSPANRAYLDMKYDKDTPYGHDWAGYVEAEESYDWDPANLVKGAPADSVLGVSAPMWTESIETDDQIEYMAFPRLPGIAEIGWSPRSTHNWDAYRDRLAQQGPRWDRLGIDYWRSPQVRWPGGS